MLKLFFKIHIGRIIEGWDLKFNPCYLIAATGHNHSPRSAENWQPRDNILMIDAKISYDQWDQLGSVCSP